MRNIKRLLFFGILIFTLYFKIQANAQSVEVGRYSFTLYAGADYLGSTNAVKKIVKVQKASVHVGTYTAGGNYPTRARVEGPSFTPESNVSAADTYYLYYVSEAKYGDYVLKFISSKNNPRNTKIAGSWVP